jgi:hypothetical protein
MDQLNGDQNLVMDVSPHTVCRHNFKLNLNYGRCYCLQTELLARKYTNFYVKLNFTWLSYFFEAINSSD